MDEHGTVPPSYERFMRRCIELALIAKSRNNTPVGSVVVVDGAIIGEGMEELPCGINVTGHAEVTACQSAADHLGSKQLEGALLFTTAEPCFMCSYVIRECRIAEVVYGVETPIVGGITSNYPILIDAGLSTWAPRPYVVGGILQADCRNLR